MYTVKEYYSRKILGVYGSKSQAQKAINEMGLMWHHSKGNTIVAIR